MAESREGLNPPFTPTDFMLGFNTAGVKRGGVAKHTAILRRNEKTQIGTLDRIQSLLRSRQQAYISFVRLSWGAELVYYYELMGM